MGLLAPDFRRIDLQMPPQGRLDDDLSDLVIELASPTDTVTDLVAKMREYQDNGVRLGWLILPSQGQVQIFAAGSEPLCLDHPVALSDTAVLPGLSLDLTRIWQASM